MFSIKVGTTNLNGAGALLTNAHEVVSDFFDHSGSNITVSSTSIKATSASWNAPESKEIQIDATNKNVTLTDYVDVDVDLHASDEKVAVIVNNAKRGDITTGKGDDMVEVTVQSNSPFWSNQFNIVTGEGNDRIVFHANEGSEYTSVNINAGDGNDYISIKHLDAGVDVERIIDAGNGNDRIVGSASDDTIFAGRGDDIVYSGDGNDFILGGYGNDTINSGNGDDRIYGGYGDDIIMASNGNDTITGGAGSDRIYAGNGNDQVSFDAADTIVSGGAGFDSLVIKADADVTNTKGFEAIVANANAESGEALTVNLSDGLIITLGSDMGDSVTFSESVTFSDLGQTYGDVNSMDADTLHLFQAQGYTSTDMNALQGYLADTGEVVWSDVDLLA